DGSPPLRAAGPRRRPAGGARRDDPEPRHRGRPGAPLEGHPSARPRGPRKHAGVGERRIRGSVDAGSAARRARRRPWIRVPRARAGVVRCGHRSLGPGGSGGDRSASQQPTSGDETMIEGRTIEHLWTHKTQDHPWLADEELVIDRAEGVWVWTQNGKKLL